jgi:hypothetical protein
MMAELTSDRRSVAEMDELFEKHIPAWRTSNYVTVAETQLNQFLEEERKASGLA